MITTGDSWLIHAYAAGAVCAVLGMLLADLEIDLALPIGGCVVMLCATLGAAAQALSASIRLRLQAARRHIQR